MDSELGEEEDLLFKLFRKATKYFETVVGDLELTEEMLLKFYGFFKQANDGKCDEPSPWFWDVKRKKKWEAWSCLGDMDEVEAMKSYIYLLDQVEPEWRNVEIKGSWKNVSRHHHEDLPEENMTIFDYISNNKTEKSRRIIINN